KTVSTDARVIAATNASLDREVASGRFRSDLYYRLNVVTIAVPPLRERRDDVPLLAEAFLREAAIVQGSRSLRLGSEAIKALSAYDWPGNVRELKHVIEEAALMADGPVLVPENLRVFRGSNADSGPVGLPLKDAMAEPEKEHIVRTLEKCEWNCSAAAHSLGVSRTTLYSKINKFEIVIPRKGRPSEKAGER
ncbi:MAG: helix-turn-helix domain-containing protein, partial [Candidatus Brocadiia bacterium]